MSSARASPILPTETWIKLGIGPIEKRVHFDRRLGRTKIRPRKQRKAQIDRRAVERVHSVGESDPEVLRRIKFARAADQSGGEVGPHAPVAQFVRVGQRRFRDRSAQSHAIQFRGSRAQASMSRRLSRYVICANAMVRNCSVQRRLRTRTSPPYFATMRSKLVHGTKSMTCANSVRPAFTAMSPIGKIEEITAKPSSQVQIDTKQNPP